MQRACGGYADQTAQPPLRCKAYLVYNGLTEFRGVRHMSTVSDMIRAAMAAENVSVRQMAEMVGRSPSAVSTRLNNNTLTAEAFVDYADKLGYDVVMKKRSDGGAVVSRRRGIGPRLRKMAGRVIYDTSKADAICHTEEHDGWFMELYRDAEGRFFVAHYTSWEGAENFVSQITPEDARKIYELYGDGSADDFFEEDIDGQDGE